jgi:hypothetical protein
MGAGIQVEGAKDKGNVGELMAVCAGFQNPATTLLPNDEGENLQNR